MRMGAFNMIPIFIEIILTLVIYLTLFNWQFCLLLLVSIILYLLGTWYFTERRAKSFKDMTIAD
jgi:ABC-type transport system involved in Fe-S cluster assembly fused permease/ATPase subunit